ncbi:DsrE family protein [Gallaecimonas mangrovi]|uniref:DsrE family protein n=1 Tax=Gallaecimonas mangrovi TaxID=2291597 RepID=UPI000E1FD857|nr:DsrE family protein [Gallaecimonas mangrovi]
MSSPYPGPVLADFGPVFDLRDGEPLPPGLQLKAVFDIQAAPKLDAVARFINMHARAEVAVKVAVVLRGDAIRYALTDDAHQSHFQQANASGDLIAALLKAKVQIHVCDQAMQAKGFRRQELRPGIAIAFSAMTALTLLQQQGYSLIP